MNGIRVSAITIALVSMTPEPQAQKPSTLCAGAAYVGRFSHLMCHDDYWHVVVFDEYVCQDGKRQQIEAERIRSPTQCDDVLGVPLHWWPTVGQILEDAAASPQALNPAPVAEAEADPGVQKMVIESVVDDLQPIVVISDLRQPTPRRWASGLWDVMRRLVRPARQTSSALLTAADAGFRSDRRPSRGVWLAPIDASARTQPTQKPAGRPPIRMLVTSLGTSTGEAFQAAIVNDGDKPVLIDGMRFVLEPLKSDTARRARSAIQKFQAEKPTTVKMTGYCLEFLRPPPVAGTLFRIAPKAAQQAAAPVRRILEAGSRLRREGRLNPDSEPSGYYHAIRQWAIWTEEQGFTEEAFTDAFVEHTKKTLAASGHRWSAAAEQTLRKAAPGRWRDIQEVLAAAAKADLK